MKPTTTTTLAAIVLVGAVGFTAGRISSSAPTDSSTSETKSTASERASRMSEGSGNREETASTRKVRRAERAEKQASTPEQRLADLSAIVRGENPLDRSRALLAFIDQLGPDDFEAAVAGFRSLGITESRFGEYSMLLAAWAQADPLAALDYAKANTGNRFATNTILSTWASIDPEAAIRWAESNHEGDDANPHMAGIIRSLAASDPTRATQLLTSMPRSEERGEALDAMLPHLFKQGNEATRSWIDSITDEALRNGAMLRSAERLAATDPAGTASWLLANPSEATQRRLDDVYSTWARDDEQGAIRSLAALPPGENRANALRGVVSSVAVRDPSAAVSMMDRFPNDVTDRVVQNFVWHSFGNDPSVAVNQISRITDERDRDQMYRRTMDAWLERDNAAATAWMQNNQLPPSVQEHINRRLNQQRQ
ncbi:MAG: hypothetical protein MUF13_08570 [Akkermansiaceae bacterium]|jgi:hypothetical protein|nr:hypothetical protein [Akkermansiaceae bacterium]